MEAVDVGANFLFSSNVFILLIFFVFMDGLDLRDYQDDEKIKNIFGKILSGREGYETVIDKTKPVKKCECGKVLCDEKFCSECGKKVEQSD